MKTDEEIDYDISILNDHFRWCASAGAIEKKSWVKIKDALEKQTPLKPLEREDGFSFCPVCVQCVTNAYYCPNCGQKIDWSDGDED